MTMSIEARKKRAGGPLLDAWKAVKAKHKVLATPAFKPDLTPIFAKYDEELRTYDKLAEHKDDISDIFTTNQKQISALAGKIGSHYEELQKLAGQWEAHFKAVGSIGANNVADVMVEQSQFNDNEVKLRRALWEQIAALEEQFNALFRKNIEHMKSRSRAVEGGMRKIEDDCDRLAAEIHHIITAYQKIAVHQNDDDAIDALRGLLDKI